MEIRICWQFADKSKSILIIWQSSKFGNLLGTREFDPRRLWVELNRYEVLLLSDDETKVERGHK